jgi:peptide/nickel transport system substrate-binding protein
MTLSLIIAACGPETNAPATPTTPAPTETPSTPSIPATPSTPTPEQPKPEAVAPTGEAPKYGGTLNLVLSGDLRHFDGGHALGQNTNISALTNTSLWLGDWSLGPAGGYGSSKTDWRGQYDIWENKAPNIASSWKWEWDEKNSKGTVVYQIRQGLHWGIQNNEASRLVNGREITADDVVFNLQRANKDTFSYTYANLDLRASVITKTAPWEVTVTTNKIEGLASIICRFSGMPIYAPEVIQKYGDARNWKNSVSSGPFMVTENVPGSQVTVVRNPNYWLTDPVGPGKGNQLPYLDGVRFNILPDASTRQAALRTGKVDVMWSVNWEDAGNVMKTAPGLIEVESGPGGSFDESGLPFINMNITKPPFNDIRVRQAISMAIDFNAIRTTINNGKGDIIGWPHINNKEYAGIYLGLDDPEMPASIKDLYTYNPDKAKQLLKEAGFPNGFKTSALIGSGSVDSFSIFKDYLAKVGIDMTLDVRDGTVVTNLVSTWQHEAIASGGHGPIGIWYMGADFQGKTQSNASCIDDPKLNDLLSEVRKVLLTDGTSAAMALYKKELIPYLYSQVYVINSPKVPARILYWPWVRNYSGEQSIGYYTYPNWATWTWYDTDMKKTMSR